MASLLKIKNKLTKILRNKVVTFTVILIYVGVFQIYFNVISKILKIAAIIIKALCFLRFDFKHIFVHNIIKLYKSII